MSGHINFISINFVLRSIIPALSILETFTHIAQALAVCPVPVLNPSHSSVKPGVKEAQSAHHNTEQYCSTFAENYDVKIIARPLTDL